MEKRLRSSLQTSAEEFLKSASKLPLKSSRSAIKTLVYSLTESSSDLTSPLPFTLCNSIAHCISQFENLADSTYTVSPFTPPAKRVRKSARNKKDNGLSPTRDCKSKRQSIAEKIQVYVYILRLCVFHPKNIFPIADLLPSAQKLHDNLILFENDSYLLADIASMCEEWWKSDLSGKETLISQSLPVILSRSLTLKKKVDVHRIYTLRDAFHLFDFEDESIVDLKHLLIRCVISPLYLKTEEGRKFLAFICCLSVQLTKEVCAMIKSQVPFGRKSMLEAYGEVVFRAWKAVTGECKCEIENGFLQGLVEGAMYASSAAFAASIRRIIGVFVNSRTTEGVEKLIFGLAEPVIFRSLQVANSNVRQNALHLLLDLFPLENPDATKEAKDILLEKQFFLLEKLLMDECPDVRVVAVEGSCRTLHLFWEIIPSPTITKIITKIFDCMTDDACSEVRLSTVNGVIYLLGNPQSHEVLKVLLPRFGKLIMDSTLPVRAAVVDLLLLLNDVRNFHFHKVVPIDVLLSILAKDQPLIGKKIAKLLIPSYFPSKVTEEEACNRCITLIKRSPAAGARFCEFASSEGASAKSLMKLFKYLIGLVLSSIKLDEELIEGLLTAASHLCTNLAKDTTLLSAIKDELSAEKLKSLFKVASTQLAKSSICNIISTMSLDSTDGLFEDCMDLITKSRDLSDNTERQGAVRSAHKMILSCGWFDDMFEALVGLLENGARGCHEKVDVGIAKQNSRSASRRKTRPSISSKSKQSNGQRASITDKESFLEYYAVIDGVAWSIKELLLSENTRKLILGSGVVENAYSALKVISEYCILHCLNYDQLKTCPVSAFTTLALHMALHKMKPYGSKDSIQATILDLTLDHLLLCANNALRANMGKKSGNVPSESRKFSKMEPGNGKDTGETSTGTNLIEKKRIINLMKMLTAVLKFTVDANTIDLATQYQERCLKFAVEYFSFLITNLQQHSIGQLQFSEGDFKDMFICLKSLVTYGAKLLNMVLTSSEVPSLQAEVYGLVNKLFDLVISVEKFLGYGYAARLIQVIQPWAPDLVLALGSRHLVKQTQGDDDSDPLENAMFHLPSWFYILAGIELCEIKDSNLEEEAGRAANDFSAFKRLVNTMSELLKMNTKVLDAVGVIFLDATMNALQSKKFEIVLGLLHFVCVSLVGPSNREWEELELMLESLRSIYSEVDREAQDPNNNETERQILYSAKTVLVPVWTSFIYENSHPVEEE